MYWARGTNIAMKRLSFFPSISRSLFLSGTYSFIFSMISFVWYSLLPADVNAGNGANK